MQTPKVGEKLKKLSGASTVFSKLRAALQSTGAFSVSSDQAESVSACETTEHYRASLSEECAKAAAEQIADYLRRRLV